MMRFQEIDALIHRVNAIPRALNGLEPVMQRIAAIGITGDRRANSEWSPFRTVPSLARGRGGAVMVPLAELAQAGWRVVPVPEYRSLIVGVPPRLDWPGRHWAALPPEDARHGAQVFRSRSEAQAYASRLHLEEREKAP